MVPRVGASGLCDSLEESSCRATRDWESGHAGAHGPGGGPLPLALRNQQPVRLWVRGRHSGGPPPAAAGSVIHEEAELRSESQGFPRD